MKKITILIVEDHMLLRETWDFIINADPRFSVVALCGDGEAALSLVIQYQPDIVMMDINLPGISGIETTKILYKYDPAIKILAVSLHNEIAFVKKMMQAGAWGYLNKNASRMELLRALEELSIGRKYIGEEIKNLLSDEMLIGEPKKIEVLSRRESEIVGLIKQGMSSKEIASVLHLSPKTVEVHRYNILHKLGLKNTAALINYIHQHSDQ